MEVMVALAMEGTAIMVVGQHNSRRSSKKARRRRIRGWAKKVIQDTTKKNPATGQAVFRIRTTLGTILIQVIVETLGG